MGVAFNQSSLRELIPVSSTGEVEESAALSASDLISILDSVRGRSEEIKEKVQKTLRTYNTQFLRIITHSDQTVVNVESLAEQLKNVLELLGEKDGSRVTHSSRGISPPAARGEEKKPSARGEIDNRKLVDVEICHLAADVQRLRSKITEREEAVVVVETLSSLHDLLLATEKKFLPGDLVEASKGMVNLRGKLGLQDWNDEQVPRDQDGVRAFKLLQDAWADRYSKLLGILEDLISKAVVLDEKRSELVVTPYITCEMVEVGAEARAVELSSVFTAMDVLGVLDVRLARLGDAVFRSILNPLLRHSQTVISTEVLASDADPKRNVLRWSFGTQSAEAVPEILYPKIFQVVKFLSDHVFGNHHGRMGQFGRVVWPRLAGAIIAGCLSKAVPSETSELKDFEKIAELTASFEKDLANEGLVANFDPSRGDKLSTYASDVEVHFAKKKRKHVLSKARGLLMQTDYSLSKSSWKTFDDDNSEEGLSQSIYLVRDPCAISLLARSLLEIVHGAVEDACLSTPRTALELYHACRDAILLFRAIIPLKVAAQPKRMQVAGLCHNDCLYIAHEILTFVFQYHEDLPPSLKQVFTFVDLVPLFRQMAAEVLDQQFNIILLEVMETRAMADIEYRIQVSPAAIVLGLLCSPLHEGLDHANGFQYTDEQEQFELAKQALQEVFYTFSNVRTHLHPVLAHSVYRKVVGGLMNLVIQRIIFEVLSISDIAVQETLQLQKLLFIVQERLPPFLAQVATDVSEKDLLEEAVDKLVPLWCKLQNLTNLLDMSLVSINKAWESGELSSCGFSSSEVQKLIRAIFSETALREQCLRRIGGASS